MKQKNGKIEKALKPSQRESITDFSSKFGTGTSYEEKRRYRTAGRIAIIVLAVFLLICIGYFITDTLIDITYLPPAV